jgi:diacylglycerol kinase family enzyme
MNLGIVLNISAGSTAGKGYSMPDIKQAFRNLGVETEIVVLDKKPIDDIVKFMLYQDFDVIAAAGGDGTISAVAYHLADNKKPLGILPFGTLNHFAKDLDIPLALEEAAGVIARGKTAEVDIGEVNGQTFINNSSIGIYPKIVKQRDRNKEKLNSKWIAMAQAAIDVFLRIPVLKVNIITDSKNNRCKTPFVFIGNNEYETDAFNLGTRKRMDNGLLSLYYPELSGRLSVMRFFFNALINNLKDQQNFNIEHVKEITIEMKKHNNIEVSADGEVFHLASPLIYTIRPGALTVIVP